MLQYVFASNYLFRRWKTYSNSPKQRMHKWPHLWTCCVHQLVESAYVVKVMNSSYAKGGQTCRIHCEISRCKNPKRREKGKI